MRLSLPVQNQEKILVGFSGGADSTALLHLLVKEIGAERVISLHVHHGIRGKEADEDALFASSFAESLGVLHYEERISAPDLSKITGLSLETVSRDARYRLFLDYARKTHCSYVALAHHRNDLAETFLFNLARGSSAGHAFLPAVRSLEEITVIRPLLSCTRHEIEAYLASQGLSYRVDSTNLTDNCSRNIIRHRVIPVLETLNSQSLSHIAASAVRLQEDEEFLSALARDYLNSHLHDGNLDVSGLFSLSPSLWRRVLYLFLEHPGLSFDALLPDRIASLFNPGSSPSSCIDLSEGWRLERQYEYLHLKTPAEEREVPTFLPFEIDLTRDGLYPLGMDFLLSVAHISSEQLLPSGAVRMSAAVGTAMVRPRKVGDEMQFSYGKKTLKRLFIDRKIPKAMRELIPVLEIGGVVACVPLIGCSSAFQAEGAQALLIQFIKK